MVKQLLNEMQLGTNQDTQLNGECPGIRV